MPTWGGEGSLSFDGKIDVTLDLCGHNISRGFSQGLSCTNGSLTLTNSNDEARSMLSANDVIVVEASEGSTVTVAGNLTVKNDNEGCALGVNGGTLIVEGGTFTSGADPVRVNSGVLKISGATTTYIRASEGTEVAVSGGIFSREVDDAFLAEGCACVANDDEETRATHPWRVVDASRPYFDGHALLLDGQVGLQFLVRLPEGKGPEDYKDAYVTFAGNKIDEDEKHYLTDAVKAADGSNRWVVTAGLSSIQMADRITPTLHLVEGDTECVVPGTAYCVQDYLKWALSSAALTTEQSAVVVALTNYGFYAQTYLSVQNGWTLDKDYAKQTFCCTTYTDDDHAAVLAASADYACSGPGSDAVSAFGHRLVFGSTLSLDLRFRMADGAALNSVTVGTKEVATTKSGSYYVASVRDIYATQLAGWMEVTVGDATFKISPMSYVHAA